MTQDGKIVVGNEEWKEEYESYPLGSAGLFYNAEEMLKATEEKTITNISAEIFNEYIIATFADGIHVISGLLCDIYIEEIDINERYGNI